MLQVAALANLELTPEELPAMGRDLNAILGYIEQLNELDVANVAPMAQVSEIAEYSGRDACKDRGDSVARRHARAVPGTRAGDAGGAGDGWSILQGSAGDWAMSGGTNGSDRAGIDTARAGTERHLRQDEGRGAGERLSGADRGAQSGDQRVSFGGQ